MQTKHTPGPWVVSLSTDARVDDRITGANGATVVRGSIGYTPDAALIAAAPDLLVMVRDARHGVCAFIPRNRDEAEGRATLLARIDAVIARATGEA